MAVDIRIGFNQRLIDNIKSSETPWQSEKKTFRTQVNAVSGNAYMGMNEANLGFNNSSNDPRWCTEQQAEKEGWKLKEGAIGQPLEFTKVKEVDGKKEVIRDLYTVYHASDIEGIPPYTPDQEQEQKRIDERCQKAAEILEKSGARIVHDQTDKAFYRKATDSIHLPPINKFDSPEKYYTTALYGMSMWTGHNKRMGREYGQYTEIREEFRANLVTYKMSQTLGLPTDKQFVEQHPRHDEKLAKILGEDVHEYARAAKDAEIITGRLMELTRTQTKEQTQAGEKQHSNLNTDKSALDAAAREAALLGSVEKSADRTHVGGQHVDPNGPEAAALDAAADLQKDAQTLSGAMERGEKVDLAAAQEQAAKIQTKPRLNAEEKENVHEKELESLTAGIKAENKSAQVTEADTARKKPYEGEITQLGEHFAVQKLSKNVMVIHSKEVLDTPLEVGKKMSITYDQGMAKVASMPEKDKKQSFAHSLSA